jgi:hypothetical protein
MLSIPLSYVVTGLSHSLNDRPTLHRFAETKPETFIMAAIAPGFTAGRGLEQRIRSE